MCSYKLADLAVSQSFLACRTYNKRKKMELVLWPRHMCLAEKGSASCLHFLVHKRAVNIVYRIILSQSLKNVCFMATVKCNSFCKGHYDCSEVRAAIPLR